MATLDRFITKTSKSSEKKVRPENDEDIQLFKDEEQVKSRKSGKRKNTGDVANVGKKLKHEADGIAKESAELAVDGSELASTVEISYEDYLTENCNKSNEESTVSKVCNDAQNSGRDIRNFFSKGPANNRHQIPSFSTIKVIAEVHEPFESTEPLATAECVSGTAVTSTQKESRKRGVKHKIEITDDDLVIECLDDEPVKSDTMKCQFKTETSSNTVVANGSASKDKNSVDHQVVEPSPKVNSECKNDDSTKSITVTESTLNKETTTEKQNLYDVLMGRQKKEPDLETKQSLNPDSIPYDVDDQVVVKRKRGRPKGRFANGCLENHVENSQLQGEKMSRDDEETCVYLPDSASDEKLIQLDLTSVEQASDIEQGQLVKELPTDTKSNTDHEGKIPVEPLEASSQMGNEGTELRRSKRLCNAVTSAAITLALKDPGTKKKKVPTATLR